MDDANSPIFPDLVAITHRTRQLYISKINGELAMPLFSKAETIDTANKKRVALLASLREAEAAFEKATAVSDTLALDNADAETLKKAESNVTECQALIKRREAALATKDAEIAALKAKEDEANDLKTRAATVREIETALAKGQEIGKRLSAALADATDFAKFALLMAPEAQGLLNYTELSGSQIPDAIAMLDRLMREHAAGVLRKSMPATLKRPPPVTAPVVAPPPPMTTVFATRSIKFTDPHTGKSVLAAQYRDVEMPPEYARAALDHKVAVRLDDPVRRQHHGAASSHPNPDYAFDLDTAMKIPRAVAGEPIRSTAPQFEAKVGKPKLATVAR